MLFLCAVFSVFAYSQAPSQSGLAASDSATASSQSITVLDDDAADSGHVSDADVALDPASLLPDLPALPHDRATLIGGTIDRLDRVRDELTLRVFGGNRMKVDFDPRTRIYQNGAPATVADLHQGDRVYVDTILNGDEVFARSIRLRNAQATGESQGIVLSYHPGKQLTMRDALSPHSVEVRLTPSTQVIKGGKAVPASYLGSGDLVAVQFGAQGNGHAVAQKISILARPGENFTFSGTVTTLDLRTGLLVLTSTERKQYEVYIDAGSLNVDDNLRPGADVTVITQFDGKHYVVRRISVNEAVNAPAQR